MIAQSRGRPRTIRTILLVGFGVLFAVLAIDVIQIASLTFQPALNWSVSGRGSATSTFRGTDGFQVTISNHGPAVDGVTIYINGQDGWFDHHSGTIDAGECSNYTYTKTLYCPSLGSGETKTYGVTASPTSTGTFHFQIAVGEEVHEKLLIGSWTTTAHPNNGLVTWTETIT